MHDFFRFMIHYRLRHPVIQRKLPKAVCGMEPMLTHGARAENLNIDRDARTMAISFAGYDREKGRDDLVYVAVNTYWEDVDITLPELYHGAAWYLSVNTYGDGYGRYCYPEGEEVRIDRGFVMRPRSVAIFTGRFNTH